MNQFDLSALHASRSRSELDHLERHTLTSKTLATAIIFGLPIFGMVASLGAGLPLFAALMSGCFLLTTALMCRKAMLRFTSLTLRLLVAARLVIIIVLGALLFCTGGGAWMAIVSAVLLWLASDRLMGRRALGDLYKLVRQPR